LFLIFIFIGNYCFGINNTNWGRNYIIAKPKRVIIIVLTITKGEFIGKDSV